MSKTTDSRKPGTARATWTGSSAVSLRFTHQVKLSSSFWDRSRLRRWLPGPGQHWRV